MQTSSLFDRPDTLLGVCQGIGDDLGFNPLWLRIMLAVGVLWDPVAMIAIYLALGVLVFGSRLIAPAQGAKVKRAATDVAEPVKEEPVFAKAA